MPTLEAIRELLDRYEPQLVPVGDRNRAAVALVLRASQGGPQILFIERAEREGDPWSGHMAFPGGRLDPEDVSSRAAAERETEEEVGLSLRSAAYLGRLDDLEGGPRVLSRTLLVSAHVYELTGEALLAPNHEVREAFWFPVAGLLEEKRHVDYEHPALKNARYPGILVGLPQRHVVWGLTYRILERLLELAGRPLPERWGALREALPGKGAAGQGEAGKARQIAADRRSGSG